MIDRRLYFGDMPDDVFNIWIIPIVQEIGWPFNSPSDRIEGTRWMWLLGLEEFCYWAGLEWFLINIKTNDLNFNMTEPAKSIIDFSTKGISSEYSKTENTKERFYRCVEYIKTHNALPSPIVVVKNSNGLTVMDGNHRLASVLFLYPEGTSIPAWCARPKNDS